MPSPSQVHHHRVFVDRSHRDAYADGLHRGASLLTQGHGSDPWQVRTEDDLIASPAEYHAYLQTGRYVDGDVIFE